MLSRDFHMNAKAKSVEIFNMIGYTCAAAQCFNLHPPVTESCQNIYAFSRLSRQVFHSMPSVNGVGDPGKPVPVLDEFQHFIGGKKLLRTLRWIAERF